MKKTIVLTLSAIVLATISVNAGDAKELYDKNCAKCHGEDGKGATKMGEKLKVKDFTDAKRQADLKDEAACKAIKEGVKDGDKTLMKANPDLTDEQIKDLVAFIRKFKK